LHFTVQTRPIERGRRARAGTLEMPIKSYLGGRVFAPETLGVMSAAFVEACVALKISADPRARRRRPPQGARLAHVGTRNAYCRSCPTLLSAPARIAPPDTRLCALMPAHLTRSARSHAKLAAARFKAGTESRFSNTSSSARGSAGSAHRKKAPGMVTEGQ
jgi:hypothetical protein